MVVQSAFVFLKPQAHTEKAKEVSKKFFEEKGNTVLGFDLDEEFLNFGKSKNVNLKKGSLENL